MSTAEPDTHRISAEAVERYLLNHPEFFLSRDDLLISITIPHATGGAVSLVERQVMLLRDQNRRYRRQLQNLVQIARTNDDLIRRLQTLTLRLLCLCDFDAVVATLRDSLREDFQADAAALHLYSDRIDTSRARHDFAIIRKAAMNQVDEDLARLLSGGKPLCGKLGKEQSALLFDSGSASVVSAAVLPLMARTGLASEPSLIGILAIGSLDGERFKPDMDTHYLVHMGEIVSRKLASCLEMDSAN
jgi:uncharacterized protein YigA (DUF484 family)